jgi:hypothetical protein
MPVHFTGTGHRGGGFRATVVDAAFLANQKPADLGL